MGVPPLKTSAELTKNLANYLKMNSNLTNFSTYLGLSMLNIRRVGLRQIPLNAIFTLNENHALLKSHFNHIAIHEKNNEKYVVIAEIGRPSLQAKRTSHFGRTIK